MLRSTASVLALAVSILIGASTSPVAVETDLDVFMREVLAHRDDNWKKLQQYILDERERIDLRGPARTAIWSERRDYSWYIRDGFFVRSPVNVNGVSLGEADRRKYEDDFLLRAQRRDQRGGEPAQDPVEPSVDIDGLIRQTRQPQFISSAYFLRFRFEEGQYAFVGNETLDGRSVRRIEYYPTRMFGGTDRRRDRGGPADTRAYDAEFQRLMNKVALITLWIEPNDRQIVKYTFDNIAFDFLPARWFVQIDALKASMTMSQPFPDVWLPRALEMRLDLTTAAGQFDMSYALDYHDYRRAEVETKVAVPGTP